MALDSKAAFQLRASEIGISSEHIGLLETGGVASFSQFAFCCAYQPGSGNEDTLFDYLETILGVKPVGAAASNYRRLFFECHAMALKDLQSRLDRSDTSEIKILPLAEKVQRLENLKAKFPGVMLSTTLEPSHALIDKVVHQFEENCVKLVELTACTSREQEIRCDKTTPQITFDQTGNIRVTKQSQVTECSVQGEIRLRAAFTRRSLAYDLANVASFEVMESWSQLLFDRICQEPPSGYKHISIEQILVADRKLWVKVSEDTRSSSDRRDRRQKECGHFHRNLFSPPGCAVPHVAFAVATILTGFEQQSAVPALSSAQSTTSRERKRQSKTRQQRSWERQNSSS